MTTTTKPHIPGPCGLVNCDGTELSGLPCDSSPDACAKYSKLCRTGVKLIAAERKRQVEQEGWTPEHDAKHIKGELAQAAAYYCAGGPQSWVEAMVYPARWNLCHAKRQGFDLPTLRDLVKAGALIAAEIDRRLAAGEE